jgi:hypothetical protein
MEIISACTVHAGILGNCLTSPSLRDSRVIPVPKYNDIKSMGESLSQHNVEMNGKLHAPATILYRKNPQSPLNSRGQMHPRPGLSKVAKRKIPVPARNLT